MKAILEFDAPESCAACQMSYTWKRRYGDGEERRVRKCAFANTACQAHETDRAPFCPLKIVPESKPQPSMYDIMSGGGP